MSGWRTWSTRTYVYIGVAVGVFVMIVAWRHFSSGDISEFQTIVVHRGAFAQQVSVSGTVEAAQDVNLGFNQSGRLAHTYVTVGDFVRAGTLIAEMDNGDVRAALQQKQAGLDAENATLASVKTGTRPEEIAVTQSQVQSDQSALAQANAALINAIQNAYTVSDDAVHNKADQFFSNPRSYAPMLNFTTSNAQLESTLKSERTSLESMFALWQSNAMSLQASSDLQQAAVLAAHNLDVVGAFLFDANATLNLVVYGSTVTQSQVNGYVANIATARTNVNSAQSSLTSAVTAVKAAQNTLEHDQKTLALQEAGSTQEDIDAQGARVQAAQADVASARAQLAKTLILAPFDGTITRMDAKVGEIVSPTSPEISMISDGLFQIQTYIPEVQISNVAVGNPATTTLDAYGPDTFFAARVIAVDPAETVKNGISTYKTTLQFLQRDPRIRSGMTATVVITTALSPDAIVVPKGAIFDRGGEQLLQVLQGNRLKTVSVRVSESASLGNVQVLSGLSDGDKVILNPDTER